MGKTGSTIEEDDQLEMLDNAVKTLKARVTDGWSITAFTINMGMDGVTIEVCANKEA